MSINVKAGAKIHNRFEVIVEDVTTGEIVNRAYAENIVLNALWENAFFLGVFSTGTRWSYGIHFGKGTGTISPERTTLFSSLGFKAATTLETVMNPLPGVSYVKKSITILPEEFIGEYFTEVGFGPTSQYVLTHALLKDSEGNSVSLGPKTGTQQITIFGTIFAELYSDDGIDLLFPPNGNPALKALLGIQSILFGGSNATTCLRVMVSSDKRPTDISKPYWDTKADTLFPVSLSGTVGFNTKISTYKRSTGRQRIPGNAGNIRIWSLGFVAGVNAGNGSAEQQSLLRMLFPNSLWSGYKFINEPIAIADGVQKEFVLPWGDINTNKEKAFYVDSVATPVTLAETADFVDFAVNNVSGNYVRLDMKSTPSTTGYRIAEIEVYDADNVKIPNIAINGSSGFTGPVNVTDGNIGTEALGALTGAYLPVYLQATKTISKVRVSCPYGATPLVFDLKVGYGTNPSIYASNLVVDKANSWDTVIEFENPPAAGAVITGDWWVDYMPKDTKHITDLDFTITFNEGI